MTPEEWWLVYDARYVEPRYGSLTESQVYELYDRLNRGGNK